MQLSKRGIEPPPYRELLQLVPRDRPARASAATSSAKGRPVKLRLNGYANGYIRRGSRLARLTPPLRVLLVRETGAAFGFDGAGLHENLALAAGSLSTARCVQVDAGPHGRGEQVFSLFYLDFRIVRKELNFVLPGHFRSAS